LLTERVHDLCQKTAADEVFNAVAPVQLVRAALAALETATLAGGNRRSPASRYRAPLP
jgi:hypothetical protein